MYAFARAALLVVGSSGVAGAVSPVRPETPEESCEQTPETTPQPGKKEETAVTAIVTGIDRAHGVLD